MSNLILATTPPVTLRHMAVVAIGGGVVGDKNLHVEIDLRCSSCGAVYPMSAEPRALALSPVGATVLPGYVEMCPHCYHEHKAGTVLEVV